MSVSEEIIKVLDDLGNRLGIAIDWTKDNVVPYVQDLTTRYAQMQITLNIIAACVYLIIGATAGVVIVNIIRQWAKRNLKSMFIKSDSKCYDLISDGAPNIQGIIALSALGIAFLVAAIGLPVCVDSIVKWICIPELQIITDLSMIGK